MLSFSFFCRISNDRYFKELARAFRYYGFKRDLSGTEDAVGYDQKSFAVLALNLDDSESD